MLTKSLDEARVGQCFLNVSTRMRAAFANYAQYVEYSSCIADKVPFLSLPVSCILRYVLFFLISDFYRTNSAKSRRRYAVTWTPAS